LKIQLWAIGKIHDPYVKKGVEEFTDRIANYFPVQWNIFPPPKNAGSLSEPECKHKEAEIILNYLKKEDWLVVLDQHGKLLTSEQLARFLETRANQPTRNLTFLIGGAFGLDQSLIRRSQYQWSLSALTFPHQLVRLILAEQLYRACSIIRNEKYHHG
jgi:23S rRNA (pseudouridine1915-N3)-methyltransferase